MKPALPTASVAYGLNGPSATAIVDNATPAGLHLSSGKNCPNKRDRLLCLARLQLAKKVAIYPHPAGLFAIPKAYGNRLRRSYGEFGDPRVNEPALNLTATGLFAPYFSAYRTWRENGLSAMEKSLEAGKSILAITMDIEQFYHRVSPAFLLRKKFLESIALKLSRQESLFTKALLSAIDSWYRSTPDYVERPEGGIPVGLSASKIIANVLLANFDNDLVDRLKPIYYEQAGSMSTIVFRGARSSRSSASIYRWVCRALTMFGVGLHPFAANRRIAA